MPMKLKYKLKLSRPRSRSILTGKRVLLGDCYVDYERGGCTFLRNGAKKDEVLMYWSPSAMYAHHSGKIPRSILDHVTIMMNISSMEVCYTRHNTDAHPSMFMTFSANRDVCNVYMTESSAIVVLENIDSSSVQRLTCFYNNWTSLNGSLHHVLPQRFLKLNRNLNVTYLQNIDKKDEKTWDANEYENNNESVQRSYEQEMNLQVDDECSDLWYEEFKDDYNKWTEELADYHFSQHESKQ